MIFSTFSWRRVDDTPTEECTYMMHLTVRTWWGIETVGTCPLTAFTYALNMYSSELPLFLLTGKITYLSLFHMFSSMKFRNGINTLSKSRTF
jgi:hypothetical protein